MADKTKFTAFNFDASKVAPAQPMEAVPTDWYNVSITDGETMPTGDGAGKILKLEVQILDGPFKGRKAWDNFCYEHPNPQTVEIAQQMISAICHATGVIQMTDVQQLFNKPFQCKLGMEGKRAVLEGQNVSLDTEGATIYEAKNRIKGAKPLSGAVVPGAAPAGGSTAAGFTPPDWTKANKQPVVPPPAGAPVAPPPAPPAPPATPAAPRGPKAPSKPKPVAPPVSSRKFFVFIDENNMPLKGEAECVAMLASGMPLETMISQAGPDGGFIEDTWKPAASFSLGAPPAPAPVTAAGAPVAPPVGGNPSAPWNRPKA